MNRFLLASVLALFALDLAACSDPPDPTTTDGGLADGAPSDARADVDAGCPSPAVVLANVNVANLRLAGNDLVFVDRNVGDAFPGGGKSRAIRKIGLNGTGDVVLYAAPTNKQLADVEVAGTTVYFLESERLPNTLAATRVYAMPVAGGSPTLIALHDDPDMGGAGQGDQLDAIVGLDANAIYAVRGLQTAATLWRIPLAGGPETRLSTSVSSLETTSLTSRPSLVDGTFYFLTSKFTAPTNYDAIGKLAANGSNSLPSQVGTSSCRGNLVAYQAGLFCTGALDVGPNGANQQLSRFDLTGANHKKIFEQGDSSGNALLIGPSDGTFIYTMQQRGTSSGGNLWKVPVAGGPATVVACDRRKVVGRGTFETGGSNGAFYGALEMVMSPTDLAWIETRKEGSTETTSIFRVAR
jgi:hypothetical protein